MISSFLVLSYVLKISELEEYTSEKFEGAKVQKNQRRIRLASEFFSKNGLQIKPLDSQSYYLTTIGL